MSLDAVRHLPWDGDTAARRRARTAYRNARAARMVPGVVWTCAIMTPVAGAVAAVAHTALSNRDPQEAATTALMCLVTIAPYVPLARAVKKLTR